MNYTFEENAEKLIKQGKTSKEAYGNRNRHYFFVPKGPSIVMISSTAIIAGIVMIVIRGILSAIGVIRKPSPVGKTARVQVPSENANRREEKGE